MVVINMVRRVGVKALVKLGNIAVLRSYVTMIETIYIF